LLVNYADFPSADAFIDPRTKTTFGDKATSTWSYRRPATQKRPSAGRAVKYSTTSLPARNCEQAIQKGCFALLILLVVRQLVGDQEEFDVLIAAPLLPSMPGGTIPSPRPLGRTIGWANQAKRIAIVS
jgi:hypothetical protein